MKLYERDNMKLWGDLDFEKYLTFFKFSWWSWVGVKTEEPTPLPENYAATLYRWYDEGVDFGVINFAIDVTMHSGERVPLERKFNYFCGIMKNFTSTPTDVKNMHYEGEESE